MTGGQEEEGEVEDRRATACPPATGSSSPTGPPPLLSGQALCAPSVARSCGESKLWQTASEHAQKADPSMGTGTLTGFVWENKREAVSIWCGAVRKERRHASLRILPLEGARTVEHFFKDIKTGQPVSKKMLNVTNQEDADQNHSEIPPHSG